LSAVPPDASRFVADLMVEEPIVVRVDAHPGDAAALMARHQISGLPVVDPEGLLVGVISDADLLRARATEHLWSSWPSLRIRHLMTSPALTILRDQPLTIAAKKMERHHVSLLVVVSAEDEGRPIGVICTSDLVRAMSARASDQPVATAGPAKDARGRSTTR
jgi:CBS domain-containing protein